MATINNTNGQLEVVLTNKTSYYQFSKLSNVAWFRDNSNDYYFQLTYEDDYFVRIPLSDVTNQPAWTNDVVGAEQAVKDISTWIGSSVSVSGLATEATLQNVDLKLTSLVRTPALIRATGSGTIAPAVYDFSVSNVGSANGTILGQTIKPGETLNFGAGAVNNYYAAGTIAYNGTGTELVIIYNS